MDAWALIDWVLVGGLYWIVPLGRSAYRHSYDKFNLKSILSNFS